MKFTGRNRIVSGLLAVALIVPTISFAPSKASAFTSADADAAMRAYNTAFWNPSNKMFKLNNTGTTPEKFWTTANEWQMVMDAYQRTNDSAYLTQINDFYDGFIAYWGTDWLNITHDSDGAAGVGAYYDDMMWMVISTARAYQITGQERYKTQAKKIFDQTWSAAYTTALGGGLLQNRYDLMKNACINAPTVIGAYKLYQILGDSAYLTKATDLYAWTRSKLFDTTTGNVYDNINGNGVVDKYNYTYNSGTFIGAAHLLYKETGDVSYYNDALLALDYVKKNQVVPGTDVLKNENNDYNQPGFKGIFILYAANFVKEYNLTPYITWFQHMADTVYNHRGPNADLTYKNFAEFGKSGTKGAWEAFSGTTLLQVITPNGKYTNLTLNKTATSNGQIATEPASKAVDGAVAGNSKWTGTASGDKWLSIDLGQNYSMDRLEVQHAGAGGESIQLNTKNFKFQVSTDGSTWTDVITITNNTSNQTIRDFTAVTARYVRLYITQSEQSSNGGARIYEFEVFGQNKTLMSIKAPAAISGVANGTAKTLAALRLPATVELVTDEGSVNADVTWDVNAASYDPAVKTEQTFTVNGTVTMPAGVINPSNVALTTSNSVTVLAAAAAATPKSTLTGVQQVLSGQTFDVTMGLSNVTQSVYQQLYAQDFTLQYDPASVEFDSVTSLKDGFQVIDKKETPGQLRIVAASVGANIPAQGDLLAIKFKAKPVTQATNTTISVDQVKIANAQGNELQLGGASREIQITVPAIPVDKALLNGAITSAQTKYAAAVEGNGDGLYVIGSKAHLQSAIDAANAAANNSNATQQQVDSAKSALEAAVLVFDSKKITADINGNGVSIGDLASVAVAYGKQQGQEGWNAKADVNHDGNVDILDLSIVAKAILQ